MKTNTNKNQKSGLKSRPEQLSTGIRPQIDFACRVANRSLETEKLLALLRSETPNFFEIAEVVGKWVWIQFADKQPSQVTRVLAELGFHWNNARKRGSIRAARPRLKPRRMTHVGAMAATSLLMLNPLERSPFL